ncbi:hypothetical protein OHR68_09815 [Spirillospora sp. NBC_00431]
MATSDQIDAAAALGRRAKAPSSDTFMTGAHALGGAYAGQGDPERAAAEMFVRRVMNRHDCQAARRHAEDQRMGWVHMRYVCDDPRHDEDVAALAEALEWLGLRPTVRTGKPRRVR